ALRPSTPECFPAKVEADRLRRRLPASVIEGSRFSAPPRSGAALPLVARAAPGAPPNSAPGGRRDPPGSPSTRPAGASPSGLLRRPERPPAPAAPPRVEALPCARVPGEAWPGRAALARSLRPRRASRDEPLADSPPRPPLRLSTLRAWRQRAAAPPSRV